VPPTVDERDVMDAGGSGWMIDSCCRGSEPSVFFPGDSAGVEIAQRICKRCPVRVACLEYALAHHIEHGVWGGISERGRRRLAQQRRLRLLPPVR
jgi:WhiB family redox-sensing transcriptional regulator